MNSLCPSTWRIFSCPNSAHYQSFLWFAFQDRHYQFRFPFDLSLSARFVAAALEQAEGVGCSQTSTTGGVCTFPGTGGPHSTSCLPRSGFRLWGHERLPGRTLNRRHPPSPSPFQKGQDIGICLAPSPTGQADSRIYCHSYGSSSTALPSDVSEFALDPKWHRARCVMVLQGCIHTLVRWRNSIFLPPTRT